MRSNPSPTFSVTFASNLDGNRFCGAWPFTFISSCSVAGARWCDPGASACSGYEPVSSLSGVAGCANSRTCDVWQCIFGYADCNADTTDGCEEILLNSTANCGACGFNCSSMAHVDKAVCRGGICLILSCLDGWGNCDGDSFNGCETDTTSSTTNCARCGSTCLQLGVASASCGNSQCRINCSVGFADCDGIKSNGCEVDLNNSATQCGDCSGNCYQPGTFCFTASRAYFIQAYVPHNVRRASAPSNASRIETTAMGTSSTAAKPI